MIGIIDYEIGNLRSVEKAVARVGGEPRFVHRAEDLDLYQSLILPGVGAFGDCVKGLRATGMWDAVTEWIRSDRPLFGICVGYQMLFESSEESPGQPGLGVLAGKVVKFQVPGLKVPQMGWNQVQVTGDSPYLAGVTTGDNVYFVHSYYAVPKDRTVVALEADYGGVFPCAIARKKLFGTQFHPEKSQRVGLKLVENFVKLTNQGAVNRER